MNDGELTVTGRIFIIVVACPFCGEEQRRIKTSGDVGGRIVCVECGRYASSISAWPNEEELELEITLSLGDDVEVTRIEEVYE